MKTTDTFEPMNASIQATGIRLRKANFQMGIPFMMFSKKLSEGESYLEYPDGHIDLTATYDEGNKIVRKIVKTLSMEEADQLRREHGFY